MQRPSPVPDAHDLTLDSPSRYDEVRVAKSFPADDQTMVARRLEGVGKTLKNTLAIVQNQRRLAVHDSVVPNHFATENIADALMAKAYAQQGNGRCEALNHVIGNTGFARSTGTRGNYDMAGLQRFHLLNGDLVIAKNLQINVWIQLPKALDQIVGEGIVVIDKQDHTSSNYPCFSGKA